MDADDVIMFGSHADEHVANMWDKIGNSYHYNLEMILAILFGSLKCME